MAKRDKIIGQIHHVLGGDWTRYVELDGELLHNYADQINLEREAGDRELATRIAIRRTPRAHQERLRYQPQILTTCLTVCFPYLLCSAFATQQTKVQSTLFIIEAK